MPNHTPKPHNSPGPASKHPKRTDADSGFTDKEIEDILGFLAALKTVHVRLIGEGYRIEDGKLIPPSSAGTVDETGRSGIMNG